jgi:ribonuclease HI
MITKVECWFDGSCEPGNPGGHTSYGALVKSEGKTLFSQSGYVGFGPELSSNVGEYCGCIAVMKFLIAEGIGEGIIFGDSKLVIQQLSGRWKAKRGLYVPYYREAMKLVKEIPEVRLQWIRREQNTQADWLSRQAIKTVPRSESRAQELMRLITAQRSDLKDPRFRFQV